MCQECLKLEQEQQEEDDLRDLVDQMIAEDVRSGRLEPMTDEDMADLYREVVKQVRKTT